MNSTRSPYSQAIACFAALVAMGYPIAYARSVARVFDPRFAVKLLVVAVVAPEPIARPVFAQRFSLREVGPRLPSLAQHGDN